MTDREMLEFAAKAAEIEGSYGFASDDYYYHGNTEGILTTLPDGQSYVWNPLTDDGDALRLAVKLKLEIDTYGPTVQVVYDDGDYSVVKIEPADDPYAATRRAIVRVAAEIGRSRT